MKKRLVYGLLLFSVVCTLAQAQNAADQSNDRPAVPPLGLGEIRPHVWVRGSVGRNGGTGPGGYFAPKQVTTAYGVNLLTSLGQGATVAIVDAFDSPNVASDLAYFSSYFTIACPGGSLGTFTKVNQSGATSPLPRYNSGWEVETSLDTQWVRAIAPCANIVLVEANSNSLSNLLAAVNTAATLGSVVSMSWGGSEFPGEPGYDSYFVRSGVTFLASSGDTGGVVEWPSSSPNVIGVGGTNLTVDANNAWFSETAWNGSGGGCSVYEVAITAQQGFLPSSPACAMRGSPDVSMNGGGSSAVSVYISDQGGWFGVYGTSESVQLWAGLIAIANGMRGTPLNGTLADLYTYAAGAPSSTLDTGNYHDITSGSAGSFSAGPGWDFITGVGSPVVNSLVSSYLGSTTAVLTTITISPTSASVQTGGTQQFSATGYDQSNNPMNPQPTFAWSVSGGGTISSSGLFTAGSTAGGPFTVTAASGSVHGTASVTVTTPPVLTTITVSPTSASVQTGGTQQFSATGYDQSNNPMSPQPTFTWSVSGGGNISSLGLFTAGSTSGGPFTVTAASGSVQGTASITITTVSVPFPPMNLTARGAKRKVNLSWTQSTSAGVTGNNVYRSNNGSYVKIATLGATTSYSDTNVTSGVTYSYYVTAVSAGGESPASNTASATAK